MTLGRDAFKRRSAKMISWSLIEQSITPALMTCLACEVRITSIRELDESVTLVGEAINCDRLNDSQKLVRDFVSVHSAFRRLGIPHYVHRLVQRKSVNQSGCQIVLQTGKRCIWRSINGANNN